MTLAEVHDEIRRHCGEIADLFKPGALVSVVVRNPKYGDNSHSADMFVSDDQPDDVIAAVAYLKTRPEVK